MRDTWWDKLVASFLNCPVRDQAVELEKEIEQVQEQCKELRRKVG